MASAADPGGATATVSVTTDPECPWTAASRVEWIAVTSPAVGQGPGHFDVRVAANPDAVSRHGALTVGDQQVTIEQAAAACHFSSTALSFRVGVDGDSVTVPVTATGGCAWTATTGASWITLPANKAGSGNGSVVLAAAPNAGAARSGTATVAGLTVTIDQDARNSACAPSITPVAQTIAAAGGGGTVTIITGSGCAWAASSTASWITVRSGASGTGNGSVGFEVATNTGAARAATLTIAGQPFTVNQAAAAASCAYAITPTSASLGAGGGAGPLVAVTATAGCAWSVTSQASWIAVTSGQSGTGTGSIAFRVTANTGKRRTGTMTIAGRTFTVTQDKRDD